MFPQGRREVEVCDESPHAVRARALNGRRFVVRGDDFQDFSHQQGSTHMTQQLQEDAVDPLCNSRREADRQKEVRIENE